MSAEDKDLDLIDFEFKLQKIRTQITSKLENQKHLALILSAVEENISDQNSNGQKSPVAYFVSFLSLLEQSINVQTDEILDPALAASSAYFLDLTLPFIPKSLLKSKFPEILTKLAPAITNTEAEAPLIRSAIGALETLLIAQDLNSWNNSSLNINPKRGLGGLLEYSLDPRPKVRKRAQEAVHKILANPPPGPAREHVGSGLASDLSIKTIVELLSNKPNQKTNKEHSAKLIHTLQLISAITSANTWPASKIETLCDLLLEISKTNDQYLVSAAFGGFEGLFNSMTNEIDNDKFTKVLNIIFDLKPSVNDSHLAAAWIAVVAKGVTAYSKIEPLEAIKKIPNVLKILQPFFASEISDIYISASQCVISIITEGIPDKFLLLPTNDNGITGEIYEEVDEVITELSEIITDLLAVKYTNATKEILEVVVSIFAKLRSRSNPDFLKPLEIIGEWRTNEDFEFKNEAESVIGTAITELGPEVVLNVLPLNLLDANKSGRAWLLPLLRDNVRFARLGFFKQEFLPLIETFSSKIESLDKNSVHSKIFQTIIDQTWSLLPHFADLPNDLTKSFNDEFAQNLAQLLYTKVELRVNICHALRLLVESNVAFANGALVDDEFLSQQFSIKEAQSNVEYLSSKSSNLLAVLFNVFSQTAPESRNFVLETIDTYLSISTPEDLQNTFNKVSVLLKDALDNEAKEQANNNKQQQNQKGVSKLSATMMDLVVAMAKYVPESSYNALFTIFNQTVSSEDPLLQKRAYRIISKLIETPTGQNALVKFIESIEKVIIESTQSVHLSARASRLSAISTILTILPSNDLYFIPAILSEIILSTKDQNEKTRELSYNILIEMGKLMHKGGVVQNSKIPGFGDDVPDAEANLTEYFTMVSAGLAGSAAHMISATITAVSCLIFEFKDVVETELLVEISSTVELFLTSNNREIAKSTIGFVKVAAISLPEELVKPNLKNLLEHLLRWSHEHTGHFKSKVKHIVERLIRRFGFETIEENFPEEDKKLLTNIRKTKARAKRRAAEEGEEDDEEGTNNGKSKFSNAYDEVLYDSEDDSGDDEPTNNNNNNRKGKGNQYIMEANEEPLDLLDRQALSHISSSKPTKKGGRKINASEFEKDGRLHFSDKNSANDEDPLKSITSGINAYVEAVKSGPVKGQKNKFKFKRGAKANDDDGEDDGNDDELAKPKRQERSKIGGKGGRIGKPKQKLKARKKL
ncbi:Ribosomal RNA-processing protein [Wickerhamomyces ciferrii]|uniref:Ribosomal RNA-processing protein n=1 Tax=Wickerhamomyces ciferrii (strain ATCC 14091 / BCRC 22168 / CBS 111 / JCM 3599 / NBRC 0793 / NRRL Y-1031 F-60-10) TaxID=1206466 RepID=K0KFI6_WICCF|nr:Ribosomal RNA-processing protein [Wickerhamomyces ciferrii]CCH43890.1 Ribosomal RNA-processing protein [Wickerhamomyces ciferrii]